MVIFIKILIQKINGFDQAPISGEIGELISVYIILLKGEDLKEPKETLKFAKVKDWISSITSKKLVVNKSKTPDNGMSS